MQKRLGLDTSLSDEDEPFQYQRGSSQETNTEYSENINSTQPEPYRVLNLDDLGDGVNDAEFNKSINEQVAAIEREMITFGDDTLDTNDLRNVEFRIQSERILTVLDRCISNVEVGFYLPLLLESSHASPLKGADQITDEERTKLQCAYEQFLAQSDPKNRLEKSKKLLELVFQLSTKYKLQKHFPFPCYEIPLSATRFLEKLRELRSLAEFRITWTAPKAMAKEKRLHTMWKENEVTQAKVKEMYDQVLKDKAQMELKLADNKMQLSERSETVRQMEEMNREEISKTIYVSNLKMNKISSESAARQKILHAEAKEAQEQYEAMLQENLTEGKKMRENKLKAQQKVQAWLAKYDTDVGERSKELFKIKDELEEETLNLQKWMLKYEEQETEYNEVMELIRAEQIRVRDEKVRLFSMNFAARKIQRAFRRMLKKRKKQGKKKGKKGKK